MLESHGRVIPRVISLLHFWDWQVQSGSRRVGQVLSHPEELLLGFWLYASSCVGPIPVYAGSLCRLLQLKLVLVGEACVLVCAPASSALPCP